MREIKEDKARWQAPETLIRNLVQHVEIVAPPPLVPFTEEPPSLVGNPASWVSAMCPLCHGNPQQCGVVEEVYNHIQTSTRQKQNYTAKYECTPLLRMRI